MSYSLSYSSLSDYVISQLDHFFPDGSSSHVLKGYVKGALKQTQACIDKCVMWSPGCFSHLHSSQYCIFLYFLARLIWLEKGHSCRSLCDKLFFLNKLLNGIDLFYEIKMPSYFFIGHSVGIVLSKASYSNFLVLYQGCTVGKNNGIAPSIGHCVILYPHSSVIGDCRLGDNVTISAGVTAVDLKISENSIVFPSGNENRITLKTARKNYIQQYFRL